MDPELMQAVVNQLSAQLHQVQLSLAVATARADLAEARLAEATNQPNTVEAENEHRE